MERKVEQGWRICALCRNLEVVEQGREFPQIADTEFMVFRCRVFGWTSREDYLMQPSPEAIDTEEKPFDCPRWEPWSKD
ncbi:MAG: hypothetical protein AB1758_35495 [Candidatus Eremiobacterota bacterium]